MNRELTLLKNSPLRVAYLSLAIGGLCLIYLVQKVDFWGFICKCEIQQSIHFIVNKSFRVFANDICMLAILHTWFNDKKITILGLWIQLLDTFVLLPVYLVAKLLFEGVEEISSPLLSQFHRLIINPIIMILLIPAIYIQRFYDNVKYE